MLYFHSRLTDQSLVLWLHQAAKAFWETELVFVTAVLLQREESRMDAGEGLEASSTLGPLSLTQSRFNYLLKNVELFRKYLFGIPLLNQKY